MSLEGKFRKKETVADRQIAGEAFLIPICGQPVDLQKIFILNPVADFVWQQLGQEHTLAQLQEAVVGHFAVEPLQARKDLEEFVGRLLEQSLVERIS